MRKFIIGIIIVVALVVVFMRGDSFFQLIDTIQTGSMIPIVIAIFTQLGKYVSQSFAFSNSFKTVGEKLSPKHTINLVFGQFFMNTVAPSVGVSGIALVVDDSRRRGIPAGRATSAALLMQISIDSGFLIIMIGGFIVLAATGQFTPGWLVFMIIVAAIVGAMVGILVLGYKKPSLLLKIFHWVEGMVNKVITKFKKKPLDPWADQLVNTFGDAAGQIAHNPNKAVKVFLFSILASICELTCFILCGVGFGVTLLPALIGGYVVATLFAMVSVTPQGVGFVEAAILVMMSAYGINTAAATAIGIVYRGLVFWMPFAIGAVLINKTKTFQIERKPKSKSRKVRRGKKANDSVDGDAETPSDELAVRDAGGELAQVSDSTMKQAMADIPVIDAEIRNSQQEAQRSSSERIADNKSSSDDAR